MEWLFQFAKQKLERMTSILGGSQWSWISNRLEVRHETIFFSIFFFKSYCLCAPILISSCTFASDFSTCTFAHVFWKGMAGSPLTCTFTPEKQGKRAIIGVNVPSLCKRHGQSYQNEKRWQIAIRDQSWGNHANHPFLVLFMCATIAMYFQYIFTFDTPEGNTAP